MSSLLKGREPWITVPSTEVGPQVGMYGKARQMAPAPAGTAAGREAISGKRAGKDPDL